MLCLDYRFMQKKWKEKAEVRVSPPLLPRAPCTICRIGIVSYTFCVCINRNSLDRPVWSSRGIENVNFSYNRLAVGMLDTVDYSASQGQHTIRREFAKQQKQKSTFHSKCHRLEFLAKFSRTFSFMPSYALGLYIRHRNGFETSRRLPTNFFFCFVSFASSVSQTNRLEVIVMHRRRMNIFARLRPGIQDRIDGKICWVVRDYEMMEIWRIQTFYRCLHFSANSLRATYKNAIPRASNAHPLTVLCPATEDACTHTNKTKENRLKECSKSPSAPPMRRPSCVRTAILLIHLRFFVSSNLRAHISKLLI